MAAPRILPAAIISHPNQIQFSIKEVGPPSLLYIGPTDSLQVVLITRVASEIVEIRARIMKPDGDIIPLVQRLEPTTTLNPNRFTIRLTEGFLLSVTADVVQASSGGPIVYCSASITRTPGNQAENFFPLFADYINAEYQAGWPGPVWRAPWDGAGLWRILNGTDPAPGVEVSESVPLRTRWRVAGLSATLTTDATVATRTVRFRINTAGAEVYRAASSITQTASQVIRYLFTDGVPFSSLAAELSVVPIPRQAVLVEGHVLATATLNLQAGDDWSSVRLWVEDWIQF